MKAGYWLRPFDMLADKRRWRWQERAACGLPAMTDEAAARLRAVLVEAIAEVEPMPVVPSVPVVAGDCVETVILVGERDELRCTVAGVHDLHGNVERGVRWARNHA